jgi:hypothetical protein
VGGPAGPNEETHGYAEYRLTIQNHSPTAGHRVTLTIPGSGMGMGRWAHLRSIKCSAEVEPGEEVPLSLFQPNLPLAYGQAGLQVAIDGRVAREPVPLPLQHNRGNRLLSVPAPASEMFSRSILAPSHLTKELDANVYKTAIGQPPFSGQSPFGSRGGIWKNKQYHYVDFYFFHEAQVSSWSNHWLSYSGYDGVVLRAADVEAISAEGKAALWQYVECGGSLLIVGSFAVPSGWNKTRTELDGLTTGYYPGFGQCLTTQEANIGKWEPEQWRLIATMWDQSARPWRDVQTRNEANRRFPVVENIHIPVRTLFLVMLVFAIVIGPVNIHVLTRINRRFWLLWTVPLVSLLTCAGVVGFMTRSEGWQGQVRIEGMTILDETTQRATSAGWLGLYTPMTPPDGLHFHHDTEVTPHLLVPPNEFRTGSPRTIDWTRNDQNLRSGWVTARMPSHFLLRCSERRPEHLVVNREKDGSLSLLNALGAPIGSLWLADREGKIHTASAVEVGAKTTLAPTTRQAAGKGARLREAFSQDWLRLVDTVSAAPEEYLRPGHYLAVLDSAPFFPQGLRSAALRPSRSVVLGIMKTR